MIVLETLLVASFWQICKTPVYFLVHSKGPLLTLQDGQLSTWPEGFCSHIVGVARNPVTTEGKREPGKDS